MAYAGQQIGQGSPKNWYDNDAFTPPWDAQENPTLPPSTTVFTQGGSQFGKMARDPWSQWLDAAGAGDPGGIKMAPLRGLKSIGDSAKEALEGDGGSASQGFGTASPTPIGQQPGQPQVTQPQTRMPQVNNPAIAGLAGADPDQSKRRRMGMMQNQEQKAANFYPNAQNFPYKPFGNY